MDNSDLLKKIGVNPVEGKNNLNSNFLNIEKNLGQS